MVISLAMSGNSMLMLALSDFSPGITLEHAVSNASLVGIGLCGVNSSSGALLFASGKLFLGVFYKCSISSLAEMYQPVKVTLYLPFLRLR
jgi:hypothetical protein